MKLEESSTVEFKEKMVDDINKEIISFLNSHGGTIYIGIKDDGTVLGIPEKYKDDYDLKLSGIMSDGIKPSARSLVSFEYDKNNVLVIRIKEGDKKPYYISSKGPKPSGVYIRYGRSSRPANDDEILTMISNSSGFIWEKQVSENQNLHFKTLQIMAEGKKLEFNERKLRTLGIKNKYGQFTNLGLLLSDENPIVIKFAVYGKDLNFLVKEEFSGSLVNIAERLLKYAETFNATSAVIEPGRIDRIETKSFPGSSLREGILNCICHADYSMPSNIKVEFFPAFVKLSNPGGVYKASLRDILDGTQTFRNPGLVNVLAKLNFIENYGTGILRIQEAYRNEELKPEFYASEGYFKLSLPNLNYQGERKAPAYAEQTGGYAEQKESYAEQTSGYAEQTSGYAEQKGPYAEQTSGYAEQKGPYAEQTGEYAEQKNSSQRLNPFQIESFDNEVLCFIKNSNGLKKKEIIDKLKNKNKETSVSKVENSLKRLIKKGLIVFEGESTKKGVYVVVLKKE